MSLNRVTLRRRSGNREASVLRGHSGWEILQQWEGIDWSLPDCIDEYILGDGSTTFLDKSQEE